MIDFTFHDRNVDFETYTNAKSPDAQVSKSQHSASVRYHNGINLRILRDLDSECKTIMAQWQRPPKEGDIKRCVAKVLSNLVDSTDLSSFTISIISITTNASKCRPSSPSSPIITDAKIITDTIINISLFIITIICGHSLSCIVTYTSRSPQSSSSSFMTWIITIILIPNINHHHQPGHSPSCRPCWPSLPCPSGRSTFHVVVWGEE